ncbi:hypothetical protein [Limimaricola cinnabarinus]|uniref:hypothetical protein n=1 Tax=Limimaricola cinnabarinus TaxID=1125964 RepID=UPI0005EC02B1|nr:hypothetical protein [Limimaricola cinnabarinus]
MKHSLPHAVETFSALYRHLEDVTLHLHHFDDEDGIARTPAFEAADLRVIDAELMLARFALSFDNADLDAILVYICEEEISIGDRREEFDLDRGLIPWELYDDLSEDIEVDYFQLQTARSAACAEIARREALSNHQRLAECAKRLEVAA